MMLDFPYSISDILIFIGGYLVLPGFGLLVGYYSLWYALVRLARAIVYRDTPTKHETDVSRYVMQRSYFNYMFPALDQWHTSRLRPDEMHMKAYERESLPF
jgi:hypothetical protein